jgi:thiol:disulfide interchange protein DsbA
MFPRIVLIGLLLVLPVSVVHAFDEGIDYVKVAVPQPTETDGKIEVLEYFWYGCPHCWHLEPLVKKWKESMPATAQFRRAPAILGPNWEPLARAYFAAELLGKVEELHQPLFQAVQVKKQRLTDADSIAKFVATVGIDPEAFKEAYGSFFVDMQVRKTMELTKLFGVDGVPSIIVNGKYRASASQVGGNDQLMQVVTHLVQMESQAEPAAAASEPGTNP